MTEPDRGKNGPSREELEASVPRDRSGRDFRVGIFVILGLVSFITVLFLLTDPATLRGRYMLVTDLASAGGVRRGDPVQMRGVNIGRVNGFEMTSEGRVAITLEIEGEWGVPTGSSALLTASGIFGGRTMEIQPGPGPVLLQKGDTIIGLDQGGGLMDTAVRLGGEAEAVLDRLEMLLDTPTVSAVQSSARDLGGMARELRAVLSDQRDELGLLTSTLARAAERLEATAAEAGPGIVSAAAAADTLLQRMGETRDRLDSVLGSLDTVIGRMERGEGTLGRLSRDEDLYQNVAAAALSLDELLTDIRENPKRYVTIEIF